MADQAGLPEDVRRFLVDHVTSVDQLEVLLLLHRDPGVSWDAAAVSRALYTQEAAAASRLADLGRLGLVAADGAPPRYRYAPASPDLDGLVARLADLYPKHRVTVIATIYSKPLENVRAFADAFRLRKEP